MKKTLKRKIRYQWRRQKGSSLLSFSSIIKNLNFTRKNNKVNPSEPQPLSKHSTLHKDDIHIPNPSRASNLNRTRKQHKRRKEVYRENINKGKGIYSDQPTNLIKVNPTNKTRKNNKNGKSASSAETL